MLGYLAQEQATEFDPASEAEPGKILHEVRGGEMAALREVPFRRYYGSVDATPLFVMLAGGLTSTVPATSNPPVPCGRTSSWRWAGSTAGPMWTASSPTTGPPRKGSPNQGWKDSYDSISHADGTLARGAISLCEVQGYVYAARLAGASIARQLGLPDRAATLAGQAESLRQAFEARFWCERLGTYALALDGAGRACEVRSSNAGQLLLTGHRVTGTGQTGRGRVDGAGPFSPAGASAPSPPTRHATTRCRTITAPSGRTIMR